MRLCILVAMIVLPYFGCVGQYYPAPPPIRSEKEPDLQLQLKSAKSDLEKAGIQLQLCNLYFNKPFKKKADLQTALRYAREAAAASEKWHAPIAYNAAQLFVADILGDWNDLDSAEKMLPLVNDTAKIDLLLMLSYKYRFREGATAPQLEKSIALAEQARRLSIRLHQPKKEVFALIDIAAGHVEQEKPGTEEELLALLGKCRTTGFVNTQYVYNALTQLGWVEGDHAKMMHYSLETIRSMKSTGDSLAAGDFYLWLATACYAANEFAQAVEYSRLAIEGYALHAGELGLPEAAHKYTSSMRKLNKLSEALEFALQIVKKYPPENAWDETVYNSMIGNIYRDKKQYDKAEPYFLRAYETGKKLDDVQVDVNKDLGEMYVESHQYAKARPYLNRALTGPGTTPSFRGYIHYLLYLVDSAGGNYLAAMEHLHRNHKQTDSGLAESKQRDFQKLLIQFQTQKKEDSIKLKDQNIALLNQKAVLQQSKLDKSTLLIRITISSAILLMVIATLLYRQYRIKKQANQVITQKNEILKRLVTEKEQLVTEKEWLVKEVHHRVKNNLHTVLGLLESQASHLKDEGLAAVEVSQHRIYAMSLIHQKLYQSEDIRTILMDRYLAEFVQYLRDSFEGRSEVHFILDIEPIPLAVSQAIPLALIINEAVTNSMKYAFPDKHPGTITISMHKNGEQITLLLTDNGVGMGDRPTGPKAGSLGLELMKGLTREIHGRAEFTNDSGTKITIVFDQDPAFVRHEGTSVSEKKEVYQ
jgi:two-component sensor histidine kinase